MNPTHNPPTVDPTGPCWSDFCIASFCDGIHHVDATGYAWTETRPARVTPEPTPPAVAVNLTPADILRGAARYLQLHGWTQGNLYADTGHTTNASPFGVAACALGAIGMAALGKRVQDDPEFPDEWREYQRASNALDDYLTITGAKNTVPAPNGESPDAASVGDWNDAPGRTAEEVIAALLAAADEWERQHTVPGGESR
jgi:hypothetical protein